MCTNQKFPAWVFVSFCRVACRACSHSADGHCRPRRRAESRALGPNQSLHARSGTLQQTVREFSVRFSSPRGLETAGGGVHIGGCTCVVSRTWRWWLVVSREWRRILENRERGEGGRFAQGSVSVSVRARLQTGCNGDNSGVHGRGGGGAASVAEGKGVRRDGRRGGLEQRLLELGSFLDVELGKGALLPKLDSLLLLQHKEGIELLRNLFAIASSCDVAEAHLTARF